MAGTIHGRIDCMACENLGAGNPGTWACTFQAMFKTLFDFFSAHPAMTRIAWYKGDASGNIPGGATRGSDYWDGAAPFGGRAFAVFKVGGSTAGGTGHPWYFMLQWFDMSATAANAAPTTVAAQLYGSSQVNYQAVTMAMAWAIDSGGLDYTTGGGPWNGTLLNNGNDTKGTPVWVAPSGGQVHTFPRANAPGGQFTTNKDAVSVMSNLSYSFSGQTYHRFHVWADSDNIFFIHDYGDDGGTSVAYMGNYIPRPGLTVTRPFVMFHQNGDGPLGLLNNTTYGPITYGSGDNDGGIALPDNLVSATQGTRQLTFDRYSNLLGNGYFGPNRLIATTPGTWDEFSILCCCGETSPTNFAGFLGTIDPTLVREVYNVDPWQVNSTNTRAFIGQASSFSIKWSVPWLATQQLRSCFNRAGVVL